MEDSRSKKIELEALSLNLHYSFENGLDIQNRIIRLTDDIEDFHFDWFDAALTTLESISRKRITLRISSYGGDVYAALGIVGRMQRSKCLIDTEGYGKIMSAATIVLAAGQKRSMSKLAVFMHHEASFSLEGKESEVDHELRQIKRESDTWAGLMSELTSLPKQFWLQQGTGKNLYLDAERCKQMNIIDEVF